jgi:hypothetical protein
MLPENRRLFDDLTVEEIYGGFGSTRKKRGVVEVEKFTSEVLHGRLNVPCRLLSGVSGNWWRLPG